MRPTLRSTLAFVMLCGLSGCGDDPKPEDTGNTQSDDSEDGGASDESDPTDETSSDSDETDATNGDSDETDTTSELPEPVLEDKPPATPISELNDEELAEVCAAYLKTATSITTNLDGICPAQAVITATQSGASTDEATQEACAAAEAMCVTQVTASKAALSTANCEQAQECGASIADFNACNRQIAALNSNVIVRVGEELDAPACESVTAMQASSFSVTGAIYLLVWLDDAEEAGGGSPTDENGPCERIQEQCPELGAVLDAFGGLELPSL